jgi:hypothetical protein
MVEQGIGALLIEPGSTMVYYTGVAWSPSERIPHPSPSTHEVLTASSPSLMKSEGQDTEGLEIGLTEAAYDQS